MKFHTRHTDAETGNRRFKDQVTGDDAPSEKQRTKLDLQSPFLAFISFSCLFRGNGAAGILVATSTFLKQSCITFLPYVCCGSAYTSRRSTNPRLNPFALHDVLETAPQFFQCPLAKHPILCARALKRYRTHRRVLGELLNPSNVSLGGYGYFSRSFAVLAPVYP